jgi:hypothetical protein
VKIVSLLKIFFEKNYSKSNNFSFRGDRSSPTQPPPMPEKVKIHLKNNLSMERNPPSNTSSVEKMKKSPYGRYDKSKKTTSNSAISSGGKLAKTETAKTGFETGKAVLPETGKVGPGTEIRQQQIRRARSVGPVVEAAQRELSHLDLTKVLGAGNPVSTGNPVKTGSQGHTALPKERRSRSRGRTGKSEIAM